MAEKEYIEREALQNKAFGENHPTFYDGQDIADWYEKCINETPAADVVPVRHGYWVKEKRDVLLHWHCSACKECYYLDMPNAEYCPRCGAKMDEKENE